LINLLFLLSYDSKCFLFKFHTSKLTNWNVAKRSLTGRQWHYTYMLINISDLDTPLCREVRLPSFGVVFILFP